MKVSVLAILCTSVIIGIAGAANPLETVVPSLNEQINQAAGELQEKATQHIVEGNLTPEHIQQDLNSSQEELKQRAMEKINQNLNLTSEELQKRAEEELKNQISEKVQQPGFEAIFALAGLFAVVYLLRKNH